MATVNETIIRVRQRIGDTAKTKFSDEELIGYLNDAINFLSTELISIKDAEMVKEFTVTHGAVGTAIPTDFFCLVGEHAIFFRDDGTGLKAYPLDSASLKDMKIRYFAYKPSVAELTDSLPFNTPVYQTLLNQLTAMYALNRNNIGVVQDSQFLEQIRGQIRAGKAAVVAG